MISTVSDVLTRAKTRIGTLAERSQDPTVAADDADDPQLETYLSDAFTEIAKRTDRLRTTSTPATVPNQAYVDLPPHVDVIEEAQVEDNGTSHELRVYDGAETARAAQSADAKDGRPKFIGQHGGNLWLYPIPDKEYELLLVCSMNGEHGSTAPASDTEPPTLDGLVDQLPPELSRAAVSYVVAEWMEDNGEFELAQSDRQRFERDLQKYETEPRQQRTHTRQYSPLGGALS